MVRKAETKVALCLRLRIWRSNLRPISTVFAFLNRHRAVIHLEGRTRNLISFRSCSERFRGERKIAAAIKLPNVVEPHSSSPLGLKALKSTAYAFLNANHSIMRAAVKPCVADCITLSRPDHQKRFWAIAPLNLHKMLATAYPL
jgi:hypothetical protein